jgi:hypothetical protein
VSRAAADESAVEWTEWWLPTHPDVRVTGSLKFDSAEGATLHLADPLPHVGGSGPFPTATLYGEGMGSKKLTLLNPFVTDTNLSMGENRHWFHLTIVSPAVLRGAHVEDPDTFKVDHAVVRFAGLREICLAQWPQDEKNPGETVAPYLVGGVGSARAVKVNKAMILFRHVRNGEKDTYSKWSEEQVEAVISPGRKVTLDEFEDGWLGPLESLIVFAAGAPTPLERLTVVHVAETGLETPIEVLAQVAMLAPKAPEKYPKPLLPFAALKDKDGRFFRAWWRLHDQLGLASDFLTTVLEGRMFDELKLTTRASFLESYHRALHNEPIIAPPAHKKKVKRMVKVINDEHERRHYRAGLARGGEQHTRERIAELVARTAKALPHSATVLTEDFTDAVVKTRNAYIHLDAQDADPLKQLDLTYHVAWLRVILQINFLIDLGLSTLKAGTLAFNFYEGGRKWPLTDYRL